MILLRCIEGNVEMVVSFVFTYLIKQINKNKSFTPRFQQYLCLCECKIVHPIYEFLHLLFLIKLILIRQCKLQ